MSTIILLHMGHVTASLPFGMHVSYVAYYKKIISHRYGGVRMASFKVTISDTKGKSTSKELKDSDATPLLGLQLGAETDAAIVGLSGTLLLTGGSDKSGVPMRSDVHGASRKHVLLSKGVGLQAAEKGQRVRKLMRGNTISEEIYQINCRYDGELPVEKQGEEENAQDKDSTTSSSSS